MLESGSSGSVRGASSNGRPYRETYSVRFFEPSDRLEAKKSRKISLCAIVCKNSRGFRTASVEGGH